MQQMRTEHDLLGERELPADSYYGIQTLRAVENFQITGIPISTFPDFVAALAYVKKAAALANNELGLLPGPICEAVCTACDEIIGGELHEHFVVDVIQGGAGTSSNMNANEVIANRALELLGRRKGEYRFCHPNNHVNQSQSTNDVYPTAIRISLDMQFRKLMACMEVLADSLAAKGEEFQDVLKMGRTQLQDAVPMTLGLEFLAYATTIREDMERIADSFKLVDEINMGATAIGTGLNAPEAYCPLVTGILRDLTGIPLVTSPNLVEATWDTGAYVQASGVLKRFALKLSKICNDLRLLSSGPRAGINEINLPKVQPGSSIMPGKVNPVIPEVVNQIAYQVAGTDFTITMASENGQLELNVMEPIMAYNLLNSIRLLKRACLTLKEKCIVGITANRDVCRAQVESSIGLVTALNPVLGYEQASAIAKEALESGASIYDLVLQKNLLSKEDLERILSPESMVRRSCVTQG
ncbi:aspartate ammonia-lyase [Desulfocurvus sp. DL9XJH121]